MRKCNGDAECLRMLGKAVIKRYFLDGCTPPLNGKMRDLWCTCADMPEDDMLSKEESIFGTTKQQQ